MRAEFPLADDAAFLGATRLHLHGQEQPDEGFARDDHGDVHLVSTVATGHRLDRYIGVSDPVTSLSHPLAEFSDGDVDRILGGGDTVDDPRYREGHFVPIRVCCRGH